MFEVSYERYKLPFAIVCDLLNEKQRLLEEEEEEKRDIAALAETTPEKNEFETYIQVSDLIEHFTSLHFHSRMI